MDIEIKGQDPNCFRKFLMMSKIINYYFKRMLCILSCIIFLSACVPTSKPSYITAKTETEAASIPSSTPSPTVVVYEPGTLVEYIAQPGDTLEALAARFNTTINEIKQANPVIPEDATTMPPGMPMKIPIYYRSLWGTNFQIIPDEAFVNGPGAVRFDLEQFIESAPGWFKTYDVYTSNGNLNASEMINWVALNYSINPKLILALIEFQTGALTNPTRDRTNEDTFLGFKTEQNNGVYLQISYVANLLNDSFYRYRRGEVISFEHKYGQLENIYPWQNAATAALQIYFSKLFDGEPFQEAIGPEGLAKTYAFLFGDPWANNQPTIPGSLTQPSFILPFESGKTWAYTGGPHTAWGSLYPWAAIDFAPPSTASGCIESDEFAVAVADGLVVRTAPGIVILDLDGDGDERTGWVIFYLHVATKDRVEVGRKLLAGDRIGHPSCEGGHSTGTHIHIARKFNGEWVDADGIIPFTLSGWVSKEGSKAYSGTLVRDNETIFANTNPNQLSFITAD